MKILFVAALAGLGLILLAGSRDIRRYLRIRRM